MPLDYRSMLKKYIVLVGHEEGTSFIGPLFPTWIPCTPFTDEEWAEMQRLDLEDLP